MSIKRIFEFARRLKLRSKISFVVAAMVLTVSVFFAAYFIAKETATFRGEFMKRAGSLADNLAGNCESAVLLEDVPAIKQLSESLMKDEDVSFIEVRSMGRCLFHAQKGEIPRGKEPLRKTGQAPIAWEEADFYFISSPVWAPHYEIADFGETYSPAPEKKITGSLTVGFSLKRTNELIWRSIVHTLLLTAVLVIFSVSLGVVLVTRLVQFLLVLLNGTRQISLGNLSYRIPVDRHDELGDLARAFNGMAIQLEGNKETLENYSRDLEEKIRVRTAELRVREDVLQQTLETVRKAMGGTIQALTSTVEVRDPYTSGHQRRVADLARSIATEMGLPAEFIDGIRVAGILHDIGKMSVPAEILAKPTRLTDLEYALIKAHPQVAYDILKDIEFPWPIADIIYQHHERSDGSGYPHGIKENEILLQARILVVADVVEAMASHRPYRATLGIDAALEEILKNSGTLYDKTVVEICVRLFREKGYQLK